MLESSCLCGAVRWQIDGPLQFMSHCHCIRCRKAHGAAFSTTAATPASSFRLQGDEQVGRWQSSANLTRAFCKRCGSVVPGDPWQGLVFVPAGNFDADPGVRPLSHIFVASKAPWYEITGELPRFDAYPPGIDLPVLDDPVSPASAGAIRGSCLCGAAAFVVTGAPGGCWNCHCGRCRKARSAAHASNLFLPADGLQWTRGEKQLVSFKVPDALRFAQHFCPACGSSMPRVDPERGLAIIPMGVLDDDPGIRPQAHIFVDSKAPWFEITDDLPQHGGYPG